MKGSSSLARELLKLSSPGICRGCEIRTSLRILRHLGKPSSFRHASTVSITAVNAARDIPPALKELHQALDRLKKDALSYVNISKLQLALRGLESTSPVTRIAVLGLNNQKAARSLARLLIADALSDEGAWERKLEEFGADDTRAIILRYGDENDPPIRGTLVTTFHVPSRILQRHNIEILISTMTISEAATRQGPDDLQTLKSAALIPTAEAPKSFSGGIQFITYPVHRAVVVAEGLSGLLKLGKYIKQENSAGRTGADVELAVELPQLAGSTYSSSTLLAFLDTGLARNALAAYRASTSNATIYEQGWNKSGLPALTSWISTSSAEPKSTSNLHPSVSNLIRSLLSDTTSAIDQENTAALLVANTQISTPNMHQPLTLALSAWSQASHAELLSSLEAAFASEKWARLNWYKLFWRVDDVTLFTSELFERAWLVEAQNGIIWLAGRAVEAGLYVDERGAVLHSDQVTENPSDPPAPSQPALSADKVVVKSLPWPSEIANARHILRNTTIPSLQALAQRLLLQTLSVTAASTLVSGLIYVAFPSSSLLEAGAAGALGLVWSLRRMQKRWEEGRKAWEGEVAEAGRVVLRETEERFRTLIQNGGRRVVEEEVEGARERGIARLAVADVERLLAEVVEGAQKKTSEQDERKIY